MVEQLLPKNKIYLDQKVKFDYPSVQLDQKDESVLSFENVKLHPTCYYCGDYNIWPHNDQQSLNQICRLKSRSSSIMDYAYEPIYCHSCFMYRANLINFVQERNGNRESVSMFGQNVTTQVKVCRVIKFECSWESCEKIFGGSTLKEHEISCIAQPKTKCPVDGCQWSGKIDQMIDHFEQHENSEMILCNKVQQMEASKDYYFWILRQFVLVRDDIVEIGEVFKHNIKIKLCKEVLEGVKPICLVSAERLLLKEIEGDDMIESIWKNLNFLVYFEARKEKK